MVDPLHVMIKKLLINNYSLLTYDKLTVAISNADKTPKFVFSYCGGSFNKNKVNYTYYHLSSIVCNIILELYYIDLSPQLC
jgi:hypothetical protein